MNIQTLIQTTACTLLLLSVLGAVQKVQRYKTSYISDLIREKLKGGGKAALF